jgi:hypothetical protein
MSQNHYNVIVVGGGPAGIAAGIAAARLGARTLLVEKLGCLGGVAASGIPLINFFNRNGVQVVRGIAEELVANLRKVGGTLGHLVPKNGHIHSITFTDPEWVKLIAEEMMLQENVDLLYHSFVFGAEVEDNRLVAVRVANKAGAQRYTADCFIDASGDGDLAAFAGARYEKGRPGDGLMQAMSLVFKLSGVDLETAGKTMCDQPLIATPFGSDHPQNIHLEIRLSQWDEIVERMGLFQDKGHPIWSGTLRNDELTYVNTVRVAKLDPTDPRQLSQAEIEGRAQIRKVLKLMKEYIPGMQNSYLGNIAQQIGIRESRRIMGEYVLTGDDVIFGRKFPDSIAKFGYCIDIHDPEGKGWQARQIEAEDGFYEIPYRCVVPETIDGLLVAGRCISTTHEALASTRIMACCMALGQAAGTAAALAGNGKIQPRELDYRILRAELLKNEAEI